MLKFTSADDLARLPKTDPAYPVIATLIQGIITDTLDTEYPYDPEADGFIALMQPEDVGQPLKDIWPDGEWYFTDLLLEGVTRQNGMFLAVYLINNQYGICFCIPDDDWVNGELREFIMRNLDELPEQQHQSSLFEEETT